MRILLFLLPLVLVAAGCDTQFDDADPVLDVRLILPEAFSASIEFDEDDVDVRASLSPVGCTLSITASADVEGRSVDLQTSFRDIGVPPLGAVRYLEADGEVQGEFTYSGPLPGTDSVENLFVRVVSVTLNVTSVEAGSIGGTLQFSGRSGDLSGVADLVLDTALDTNGC